MTSLPRDADNNPIPALRLRPEGAHIIMAGAVSGRTATPFNPATRVVSVYATGPVFLAFGDENVTANGTDHYFPSGVYYDFAIGGDKTLQTRFLAAVAESAECRVHISEKQ